MVVLCDSPQPVVEGPPPQGLALPHHAELAAVVEGDGRVEAAPAVELNLGPQPVYAWGEGRGETVDGDHASIRQISSASHSLDTGKARTKSEGVSKPSSSVASRMPWAVR